MSPSDPDSIRLATLQSCTTTFNSPIHVDELLLLIEHTLQAAAALHWLYAH